MNKEADPKEWLNVARKDWERMKRNLKEKDIGASSFFLQQSLEKFIKAYLLSHGWELKKVHHLDFLINEAAKYNPDLVKFKKICRPISSYYVLDAIPHLKLM
ncbi:MAG: HEPN domain-containing protein [candidate division WOR-3 bacterium]